MRLEQEIMRALNLQQSVGQQYAGKPDVGPSTRRGSACTSSTMCEQNERSMGCDVNRLHILRGIACSSHVLGAGLAGFRTERVNPRHRTRSAPAPRPPLCGPNHRAYRAARCRAILRGRDRHDVRFTRGAATEEVADISRRMLRPSAPARQGRPLWREGPFSTRDTALRPAG